MEHTRITSPKGEQRQRKKIENFEAYVSEAIAFVKEQVLATLEELPQEHKETVLAIHQPHEWRKVYEHVLVNRN